MLSTGAWAQTSLQEQINNAADGATITLSEDVNLTATVTIAKNITLNLNDHNITGTGARALQVTNGNVTITGTGTITSTGIADNSSVIRVGDNTESYAPSLTIDENVKVTSACSYGVTIFGKNASETLVVNGTVETTSVVASAISGNGSAGFCETAITIGENAKISAANDVAIYQPQAGTLTVNGTVSGLGGIEIKAGSLTVGASANITATGTATHNANGDGTSTRGYAIAIVENNKYKGVSKVSVSPSATITGPIATLVDSDKDGFNPTFDGITMVAEVDGIKYSTLADAVTAATTSQAITLLDNVALSSQVEIIGKDITLDLNGKTISYSGSTLSSGIILVHNGAGLTINATGGGSINSGIAMAAIALTKKGDDASTPAKLVVNGGTITGGNYGITGNGTRPNTDITINGGTITANVANDNFGIYHPQDGKLTITGGTITAYSAAIEMRAGTLNISGGEFTATATEFSCNANGSGTTTVGAALAIAQHTTKKDINVTISGGTFKGVKAVNESNPQANDPAPQVTMSITDGTFNGEISTADVENFISGGTFSSAVPEEYCAEGFIPTDNGDGTYGVTPGSYVAQIDGKGYVTLAEAVEAATDGQTITLIGEITISEQLMISKSVTIDLNGNNINANKMIFINGEGKNVTVKDSKATVAPAVDADHNVTYTSAKITTDDCIFYIYHSATLTLESGILESTGSYPIYIDDENAATFTMNGGYVHGAEFAICPWASATININGGVVMSDNQAAISGNGTAKWSTEKGTTVNVTGGTIIAKSKTTGDIACGIYNPQSGVVNISGGTIYADNGAGVVMRAGDLNITGGTIITTGTGTSLVGDNKNTVPMSAVVVDVDAKYPCNTLNDLDVSITGGTLTSAEGVDAVSILNESATRSTEDIVSVSGATLSGPIYTTETFSMTDDEAPYAFDNYRVKKAEYTRTGVSATTWGTVCLPFTITAAENGYKYYTPSSVSSSELSITEITAFPIAAGTPVIFSKGTGDVVISSSEATVDKTATAGSGTGDIRLVGTFEKQTITDNLSSIYFINGDHFHQAQVSLTVPAYRAYIQNTGAGAKPSVLNIVVDDNATAIESAVISDLNATEAIYDIDGRQLSAPQKGMNIMKLANGKTIKLFIK